MRPPMSEKQVGLPDPGRELRVGADADVAGIVRVIAGKRCARRKEVATGSAQRSLQASEFGARGLGPARAAEDQRAVGEACSQ